MKFYYFSLFFTCRLLQLPEKRKRNALGLDLRKQATYSEEENDPLGVGRVDGKDVS